MEAWNKDKISITRYQLNAMLPGLKSAPETLWLREANAQSLQQALLNLESAYNRFFKNKSDFPAFKKKISKQSFQLPQSAAVDWERKLVWLPKLGHISIVLSRRFEGVVKTTTVSRDPSGKHFVSLLVETGINNPDPAPYSEDSTIGVDLGLKHFAVLSTGQKIDSPRFLRKSEKKIAREQRKMERRKRGSSNRNKQRIRVAIAFEKVRNQRKDFLHKLSTRLVRENQAVAVEDLNVKGLMQNRKLAKSIGDAGWFSFRKMLEYKALWSGKSLLTIGRYEPSSKLCTCGVVKANLDLSVRRWTCSSCGASHDRDVLAANNIKSIALHQSVRRDAPELTPVESC